MGLSSPLGRVQNPLSSSFAVTTWENATNMIDQESLLQRFLRYVAIDTMADESSHTYPSSPGQIELGRLLKEELQEIGLDAVQNEHGLVIATVPATVDRPTPIMALNSHLDTSPETSGANVQPQVIRNYHGGDIPLPGNSQQVIRVADNPELEQLRGCTLITTDGNTLLGADDKAGVAIIMEAAAYLQRHPEIPHGPLRILFTCDEEIGHGVDHVDVDELQADVCYTLDGAGADMVDVETFSADLATVVVRGVNIHPSIAKGRMINALRAAGAFLARLPHHTLAPESSDRREGFLHPYTIEGGVAEVVIRVLLRDFDTPKLQDHARRLQEITSEVEELFPGATLEVRITPQYRNMADGLKKEPRAVEFARQAHAQLGREAQLTIIRGGTDGSMLTAKGLPSPNLSSGQHTPHSPLEWACLDEMVQAAEVVIQLAQIWAEA
jgi:tripeptide aminopeptidase